MANLVTLIRFILLFVIVGFAYRQEAMLRFLCLPLVVIVFVGDAIDGYVARKYNETSQFGAIFDIAIDRVIENVLWIVLSDLDLIPVWVAIVFVTRGFLVDSVRSKAGADGQPPFSMMRSAVGKWLVSGRFMRGFYGAVKGVAFAAIFLIHALPGMMPQVWQRWGSPLEILSETFLYLAVLLCMVRGAPVLAEFYIGEIKNQKKGKLIHH